MDAAAVSNTAGKRLEWGGKGEKFNQIDQKKKTKNKRKNRHTHTH